MSPILAASPHQQSPTASQSHYIRQVSCSDLTNADCAVPCPPLQLSPDMRRLKEVPEGEGFIEPLPAVPLGMVNVDGSVGPRPEKAAWAHGRQAGGPPPAASSSTK